MVGLGRTRRKKASTPWQRRRRRAFAALGVLGLVLSPFLAWRLHLRADLNQRYADIRARGLPLTLEELATWESHVPDEAAADAAYDAIFRSYHEMDLETFGKLPRFNGTEPALLAVPFPVELRTALEGRVRGNEAMLARLDEASTFKRYRVIQDLRHDAPGASRSLGRPFEVLFGQVCLLAEDGQGDAAVDAIMTGVRVARACRATPLMHTFNRATACESMILSAIYPVALRAPISRNKLKEFMVLVEADPWADDLERAATGARCVMLRQLSQANDVADVFAGLAGRKDIDVRTFLQFVDEVPTLSNFSQLERVRYLEASGLANSPYNFWWNERPALGVKPMVIAILQYRRVTGTLPDTLEVLVPDYLEAVPGDHGGSGNARIIHDATSFTVYSVGVNGKDDGGVDGVDQILAHFPLGQAS